MIMMMGMVSRYSDENAKGTLVLSDGEIKEFTKEEWVDQNHKPALGQQVLYKSDKSCTQIRIITEEEKEDLKNNSLKTEESVAEKSQEESSLSHQFSNAEEIIEYYVSSGFKKTIDREADGLRTISMRYYDIQSGDFGEARIIINESNIEIEETRNGKPV